MTATDRSSWKALTNHRTNVTGNVVDPNDADRLAEFEISLEGLKFNYAFQQATTQTLDLLQELAREQQVEKWRGEMFAGEKINTTEKRAVLHTALRQADDSPVLVDGKDVMPEVRRTQKRIATLVDEIRGGKRRSSTNCAFKHVVNIGIGGSDLGPRLVVEALAPYAHKVRTHFIANVDPFELKTLLDKISASETLFVIVSKTFTTQETLLNAEYARKWILQHLGEEAIAQHFLAVSVNTEAVEKFGIAPAQTFPMWDWVGGRYSVWSAVGLTVAIAIGNDHFAAFLKGACAMDAHFKTAELSENMPVMMALLGIWNRNFLNADALAVLPYAERLRNFPRYLQQLEMESNGKSVTRDGEKTSYGTAPVIFGECGTVSQHSFHQWLHQGTECIPADFIGVVHDDMSAPEQHKSLLTNMIAQVGALTFGQPDAPVASDVYEGHRSSSIVLLNALDPYTLGSLLALYEHKAFVQGIVWEINSFDQPGVELGKRMAKGLEKGAASDSPNAPITAALFDRIFKP